MLTSLNLSNKAIETDGAAALAKGLKENLMLTALYMCNNAIGKPVLMHWLRD